MRSTTLDCRTWIKKAINSGLKWNRRYVTHEVSRQWRSEVASVILTFENAIQVMKHDFPKGEHIELEFMIRFHPIDVTQVMQYVTLYQAFLAARRDVVKENIATTGKDSMLLAALSLQVCR